MILKSVEGRAWGQALVLAGQLLTRLPLPDIGIVEGRTLGRSVLFYPLVGLLLGLLLWGIQALAGGLWPDQWGVQAALVLSGWCLLTGGLHLDGLADAADAWIGGFGSRDKTLALMKDPTCGPVAVMVLLLLLLVKFTALEGLLAGGNYWLLWVPVLGRAALLLLFVTTPYVRQGGMASQLVEYLPRRGCLLLLGLTLLISLLLGGDAVRALLFSLLVFYGLRHLMLKRLGGTTGDTAGALVELTETAALLALVAAG